MHLLSLHPSVNLVQNILRSFRIFIETRSVDQNDATAIIRHFHLEGAYRMVLSLQVVTGPVRLLGQTVYKLLPVYSTPRSKKKLNILGSFRYHTAPRNCIYFKTNEQL